MTDETAANPQTEDATPETETSEVEGAVAPEGDSDENLTSEEDNQGQEQEAEEEFIELDHQGEKVKIPKKLEPLVLMQKDYTQKTQAVAAERATLQETAQQLAQREELFGQHVEQVAQLKALDAQIAQYDALDWESLERTNPEQAAIIDRQRSRLERQRQQAMGQFQETVQQREAYAQQDLAKRVEEARTTLIKEIPGWNDQLYNDLQTFAQTEYGFTPQETGQALDPRIFRMAHELRTLKAEKAKTSAAQKQAARQSTTPANTLRGASGKYVAAPDTGDFAAFEKMADAKLKG